MASSSTGGWKYDVFLSFRGPDTRKGITVEIHDRLNRSGIITFMDNPDLQVGDVISPTLIKAIKESRFAIVILSQNYASSTWCLEELREICVSMEDNRILPLFYQVDPTDVRYQKKSFEQAFSKHETSGRHELEMVKQWRADLQKVANISGWNTNDFKTHKELVDVIVESLRSKVPPDAIESTGDFQAYEATKQAMDDVVKALTDDKITAVGVFGMGGVGKTSMVRHVAAQACKNGTFNHWIMAVVSQNRDLKRIQDTFADLLGFELKEKTEDGRAARLYKEIMRKEKLLIIVDDVWERTALSSIGIPSYKELQKCMSKVLLTTRRFNVCHAMKCEEKIALKVLSEKDSWNLFLRNAGTISFESTAFEKIARMVAGECKGLPIALIAVARALGDKDLAEWKKAAVRLENSQYVNPNHEEDEENAFKCIRLSYDYLKNEDHKSCFLLCCLFPEDHDIQLENLFKYAFGIGLFQVAETTIEEAREAADSVIKYLKGSSLLLDSDNKGCVKMHDVIRDTALNIAQSEDGHWFLVKAGCGLKDWPPRGLHEGCTAISLMRNKIRKLPEKELVCPNLQILLLNGNADLSEIPRKLIQNLRELRVLDLSNTSISVLPQPFSLLTNLQALYLDFCKKLIEISIVGSLKKLEILSMRECSFKELSREIGHLTNLRILDVNRDWERFTIPSEVISKLHKLEELYMVYSGTKGRGEETNIGFGELAGLSNLKILQVGISDEKYIPKNVEAAPDWDYFCISIISRCTNSEYMSAEYMPAYRTGDHNSRSLFLSGVTISTLPDWFINVTEKTEKLEYDRCNGMRDILMEYDHGRLHELKHLIVGGSVSDSDVCLKELMNTTRRVQTGPVFENLEELHLLQLIHLEELCVGELPPESLSNLKVLHLNDCFILKSISKFVQRLPNLENLYLNRMKELEYVFGCEEFEPEQSKLREMHLLYLKALRSVCNGPAPRAMFQSLKTLTVYYCNLMESLFRYDVAQCLFQLEDLYVDGCPLLERVMEAVNNEKTVLPKLKNLVLKNLPMLYGPSATVDIKCPSLERLVVVDCPKLSFSASSDPFGSFKSTNQFSFSTSASDYFGSLNPVQLNDLELYQHLRDRLRI
ncbi:PREDICTED: probable disease resistance protein At4g27220 [Fragaria vesca subsp. vesca]|uniref:probable disease resistance protein At4g27220 n=1 Tax=Fragaria vesca subsp. vesca TaxID=101020 RepID=UPI0002C353C2|nr:PREDICTED: probable disease resistance protein At4g27220 [Fragaria vesca subsp. vesca]XP_011466115.1 PREDICTED: probable disease resistance protein At4g27220 [Fragaria vesca subsp. vesca]XP_011466119.1 PREDICTED: probable disease resistance protein At4g27220 [Fragaria vesca subsp. vesca]XP_011466128.1 PREDICTED: probable disease resistance protein At4g27220 [Fragaria vesca subsp. vesca]